MKWFPSKSATEPEISAPSATSLTEAEALKTARSAKTADDWPTALMALERVANKKNCAEEFQSLYHWALTCAGRRHPRSEWQKLKLQERTLDLRPEDSLALTHLLQMVRPQMVLEIGSRGGGLANWITMLCKGLDLETTVHSADWAPAGKSPHANLHFWGGDLRKPSGIWPGALMKRLPAATLIILRSRAGYELSWSALHSLHKWMRAGHVLCVESEAELDSTGDLDPKRNAADALARFAGRHPVEYEVLPEFEAQFGPFSGRSSLVHCIRHNGLAALSPECAPGLDTVLKSMANADWKAASDLLNPLKANHQSSRGVDYLRSVCFFNQNSPVSACEAAKEELRFFPDHPQAKAMLASMLKRLFPGKPTLGGDEFHQIYRTVRPYTMLSDERLYSLYLRTRLVCQMDVPGDLVECGVAAGGGSALIAATMARHTRRRRKLYACDTFEGMPVPTEKDIAYGVDAESSGWGTGTCAATPGSLMEVCAKLGVSDSVVPVKGFFKDTLPGLKSKLGEGIALLHMDGDWYESTMDILVHLYEHVSHTGFIQVDDYGYWEGCRQAMWDYAAEKGFTFNVHPIDGTGVWLQRPDRQPTDLMLLNLGCGGHFHRDWINIDIAPAAPEVIQHDLAREPLPFEDRSCAAVYHSHVLEHIPPEHVGAFLAECHRVLDVEGVLRIAVPDLEQIVREYLKQLDAQDRAKHGWMVIELVDQLTRNASGGKMMEYWKQNPMPAEDFVLKRLGREAIEFVIQWRQNPSDVSRPQLSAETIGRFRLSGEVHAWMYDRLSLSHLLEDAGFQSVRVCGASDSAIPGYASYCLDADANGLIRKPDSLFIEAQKPAVASA